MQSRKIREIDVTHRERFLDDWQTVESRFEEHPWTAVTEADDLVSELFEARGYPLDGFEQGETDVPTGLARIMEKHRVAHSIVSRRTKVAATTDELRNAMSQYREIFHDLIQTPKPLETGTAAYPSLQTGSINVSDQG